MADSKRAHSPELNGDAGAIVKKQRTDEGSVVVSAKQPKQVGVLAHTATEICCLSSLHLCVHTGCVSRFLVIVLNQVTR